MSESNNELRGEVPGVPTDTGFGKTGTRFWKSVAEIGDTPEAQAWLEDEFPQRASLLNIDRRRFLTLGAAAAALAGASGCRYLPQQRAVPYVKAPEELIAGKSLMYASTMIRNGYGMGVLVESHEGRPTKIEGNPRHPASLGATDAWAQAEILNMYDPDRAQTVTELGEVSVWDAFTEALRKPLAAQDKKGGAGLHILTETTTSPTFAAQMASLMRKFPQAKWHQYDPINRDNVYEGTRLAFGQPLNPVYKLRNARVVVSLDADFMLTHPGNVRLAREFADGRRIRKNGKTMNRLYCIESACTITGSSADHRYPVKPSDVEAFARALYARLNGGSGYVTLPSAIPAKVLDAIVSDLQANRTAAVVIPGEEQSPAVHALAAGINDLLEAQGRTVVYTAPVEANLQNHSQSLKTLVDEMKAGNVEILAILGGNPVYNAPADLKFAEAMLSKNGDKDRVPMRIRLSPYNDETARMCQWHIPESHALEAWGDARAFDGTTSIVQPLIEPIYQTKSALELVSALQDQPRLGYDIVRETYAAQVPEADFEAWWATVLHDGVVPNSAAPAVSVKAPGDLATSLPQVPPKNGVEISFRPDPAVWDGRYANNTWLQELPRPITTVVWDNVASISPRTAQKLGVTAKDGPTEAYNVAQSNGKNVIKIDFNGRTQELPVWIQPGQPDDVVTVTLGYGRSAAGKVGDLQGRDIYLLRTSDAMGFGTGATISKTAKTYPVSFTQPHHLMRGTEEIRIGDKVMDAEPYNRDIVRTASFKTFLEIGGHVAPEAGAPEHSEEPGKQGGPQPGQEDTQADFYRRQWKYTPESKSNKEGFASLYPNYSYAGYNQWGMTIDMTTCIGCNACVTACQAENNIPTVGKEEVGRGREMHWLRIDHYYADVDMTNPESCFQPVMCVHCEKAPCEPVCPVAATVHSHEGLNQMVYNRCVGTRYCSNNCPYKVRRYNFLKWTAGVGGPTTTNYFEFPVMQMAANPHVTIRGRGVMEKCTYCIQRINDVRIEAKKGGREIQDGEIVVACQQACPTNAIVFGDINNPNSEVSKLKDQPHAYGLLAELNTRPRTSYLARIKNPNPALADRVSGEAHERPRAEHGAGESATEQRSGE